MAGFGNGGPTVLWDMLYDQSFAQPKPTVDRVAQWKGPNMVATGQTNDGRMFYYPIRPASGKSYAMTQAGENLGEVDTRFGRLLAEVLGERQGRQESARLKRNAVRDRYSSYSPNALPQNPDDIIQEAVGNASFEEPPQQTQQVQTPAVEAPRQRGPRATPSINRGPMATALGGIREREERNGSIF